MRNIISGYFRDMSSADRRVPKAKIRKISIKYSQLPERNHSSYDPVGELTNTTTQEFFKPQGLWYGIKDSWVTWQCASYDNPDGDPNAIVDLHKNLYKVEITAHTTLDTPDPNKILLISTPADYRNLMSYIDDAIERGLCPQDEKKYWEYVSNDFAGVEFRNVYPDLDLPFDTRHMWVFAIDVDSGCVWNIAAIKRFELVFGCPA